MTLSPTSYPTFQCHTDTTSLHLSASRSLSQVPTSLELQVHPQLMTPSNSHGLPTTPFFTFGAAQFSSTRDSSAPPSPFPTPSTTYPSIGAPGKPPASTSSSSRPTSTPNSLSPTKHNRNPLTTSSLHHRMHRPMIPNLTCSNHASAGLYLNFMTALYHLPHQPQL